jgi:hypothetical protein
LLRRPKESRQNKTKKAFGTARILTMEEALREKEEKKKKAKEQQRMDEKERMAALRGLVGFVKDVPEGVPNGERCI